ncbi:hypothetical protein EBO33_16735 [[Curtobacterium] plantarum]|nr:hypothetical protein EBO33_16735 [[Curtobacterium] plantarum]
MFMIVSPRLVDELILSRREQALKGCSGLSFLWGFLTSLLQTNNFFQLFPLTRLNLTIEEKGSFWNQKNFLLSLKMIYILQKLI